MRLENWMQGAKVRGALLKQRHRIRIPHFSSSPPSNPLSLAARYGSQPLRGGGQHEPVACAMDLLFSLLPADVPRLVNAKAVATGDLAVGSALAAAGCGSEHVSLIFFFSDVQRHELMWEENLFH